MSAGQRRLFLGERGSISAAVLGENLVAQWSSVDVVAKALQARTLPLVLIAEGVFAVQAADLARQYPDGVHALILIAPPALDSALAALPGADVATLVLHGSELPEDQQHARAYAYKQAWPHAQLVYVYGAGDDIAAQRPGALVEVIRDFAEFQEGFLINRASTAINP